MLPNQLQTKANQTIDLYNNTKQKEINIYNVLLNRFLHFSSCVECCLSLTFHFPNIDDKHMIEKQNKSKPKKNKRMK